ncbi:hypothetical protein MACJ_002254 [Theileria orientalis]|uniref:6-Cys domain-containing protein n=1 Tax=Theileria orientalis TaxID=68886 RepID=A0A976QR81_THEOR|nr:hypothetical protein MACJ_002254 [Theileria orientalis]
MFRFLSQRFFSSAYCNLKRVKPEYIDFETNFPKVKINKPLVSLPFTQEKNLKLLKSIETPQILSNCRVVEQLSIRRVKFSGRNNTGRITTRHRGGGHVQRIRLIDFKRQRKDIYSTVLRIEYDPTRSAHIALIQYDDGVLSYILCPAGVLPGTRLLSSSCAPLLPGNCLPLRQIPVNTIIHNVEIRPGAGGQVARSGGVFCTITEKDENFATIRLSSSEIRRFPLDCWATVGQLSNIKHDERDLKKAGTRRNMGWRPTVRGIAMNPNKHPHGGGNKKGTKRPRCSIWGICKDMKTRTRKKPLGLIIKRKVCGVCPEELECDFSSLSGNFENSHISFCVRTLRNNASVKITCPNYVEGDIDRGLADNDFSKLRNEPLSYEYQSLINNLFRKGINYNVERRREREKIEDKKYRIYPENATEELTVLIEDDLVVRTDMKKVSVWDVFGTRGENIMSKVNQRNKEVVRIKTQESAMVTVKETNPILFLCIRKKYLKKVDSNFRELIMLYRHKNSGDEYEKIYLPLLDKGNVDIRVGVALIMLDEMQKVEYGCGNVETKFFKNSQNHELNSGLKYCKMDVMEKPNLGFYCEGRMVPYDCMASLNSMGTFGTHLMEHYTFPVFNQRAYIVQIQRKMFSYIRYDRSLMESEFQGYCGCVDESNRLKAVMMLERKKDHVCDIVSMLMKNKIQPIKGDWCNVTLHPGDTLKIIIPPNEDTVDIKIEEIIQKMKKKQLRRQIMNRSLSGLTSPKVEKKKNKREISDSGIASVSDNGGNNQSGSDNITRRIDDIEELESDIDIDDDSDDIDNRGNDNNGNGGNETSDDDDIFEAYGDDWSSDDSETSYSDTSDELYLYNETGYNVMLNQLDTLMEKAKRYLNSPRYTFATIFSPKNPSKYVNTKTQDNKPIVRMKIKDMLGGMAYQVDESEMEKGLINIKYNKVPLSTRTGGDTVHYYWISKSRTNSEIEVLARIKVNLAQVDEHTYGCETIYTGLFYSNSESTYCKYIFNGCKRRKVNNCTFEVVGTQEYGISCNEEETLYPEVCGSYMINSETNKIERIRGKLKWREQPSLKKYKIFRGITEGARLFDYRCSCIDNMGVEKTTMTLYSNSYPAYEFKAYFEQKKYILILSNVVMFYPKREPLNRQEYEEITVESGVKVEGMDTDEPRQEEQGAQGGQPGQPGTSRSTIDTINTRTLKEALYKIYQEKEDEFMNTLPEIEYITLPKNTKTNRIMLERGTYLKISSSPPKEFDQTTEIDPQFDEVMSVSPSYRYKGVRHNQSIGFYKVYNDPYISNSRLFPVNLTKYFYRLEKGKKDKLVPVKYEDIIATNVTGMSVKTRNCLGYHLTDYGKLSLNLPKGAIVIIKEENTETLEMIFASGAISSPEEKRGYYDSEEEEMENEKEDERSLDISEISGNIAGCSGLQCSTISDDSSEMDHSGKSDSVSINNSGKSSLFSSSKDISAKQEFDWENVMSNEDYGRKDGKSMRLTRKKEKIIEEGEPKEKRRKKDIRKMEIWGLHTIIVKSTNPWVKGCGVTDEGEDFFKPKTQKIKENKKEVGCIIDINKERIGGFYCPEPYQMDPPECFKKGYERNNGKEEIVALNEMFESREWKNTAFRYITRSTQLKKRIKMMFRNKKTYVCYCRTIKGVEMSRIEIRI